MHCDSLIDLRHKIPKRRLFIHPHMHGQTPDIPAARKHTAADFPERPVKMDLLKLLTSIKFISSDPGECPREIDFLHRAPRKYLVCQLCHRESAQTFRHHADGAWCQKLCHTSAPIFLFKFKLNIHILVTLIIIVQQTSAISSQTCRTVMLILQSVYLTFSSH